MGRRSEHTAEELRELILTAATELVLEGGFAAVSAREIARKIEYSPGTLYNAFRNLDDVLLTLEGRLLDALDERLRAVPPSVEPRQNVHDLAKAYLAFTHENPRLWNLLFEHHLAPDTPIPEWFMTKLDGLMGRLEAALRPIVRGHDPGVCAKAARVLWASVHGIASLSTADKLANVTPDAAGSLVHDLIETYLDGLALTPQPGA
ncbi:MAG: TetR/AcrR family transcriptional regulator [Hyphomicrobiaceae bacterium]|nr:TetR/AcrR family transcriptional regulator [Hyphomicrobiaceae bacterium]